MSQKATANQTFHHSHGTVFSGTRLPADHDLVKAYAPLFDFDEPEEPTLKDNYEEQPINELRNVAKSRGIDATGSKADIIARLREADSAG